MEIDRLHEQLDAGEARHRSELGELRETHGREVAAAAHRHENERERFRLELDNLRKAHVDEIAALQQRHADAIERERVRADSLEATVAAALSKAAALLEAVGADAH